jgi:hypothetical protein
MVVHEIHADIFLLIHPLLGHIEGASTIDENHGSQVYLLSQLLDFLFNVVVRKNRN